MGLLPFDLHKKDRNNKLEALYQENKAFLMAYGAKLLGSKEKAEDALQETFLAIIKNKEKYLQLSCTDFRKLAVTIMKNKCIDQIRKEQKLLDQDIGEIEHLIDGDPDPVLGQVLFKERQEKARLALKNLDPLSQQILYLKYFENKSYKEISQELEITTNLVQVKIYRAKNTIRKRLGKEGEDERR